MSGYRRNHYVPEWYQRRFLLPELREQKFRYLDLAPDVMVDELGRRHTKTALRRWGPDKCFFEDDLYTTQLGSWISTEIEQRFFGQVDARGKKAIEFLAAFKHPTMDRNAFQDVVRYMTLQKLRTPKGLAVLAALAGSTDKNLVLKAMQRLDWLYGAIWFEAEWALADASESATKFIISDHPVTVYNPRCFPGADLCRGAGDPEPWLNGTHTYFPLSLNRVLILTNTSWVRNPYGDPLKPRPNPNPMRTGIFKVTNVQTGRKLTEQEVLEINYITKKRAHRYIAATKEEWLYPEERLPSLHWSKFGDGLLLMPDPRSITFSGEVIFGYDDGRQAEAWDEYGRRPWEENFKDKKRRDQEWRTFHAFQGEFARIFGPKRRGVAYQFGREKLEDDPEYHKYHLANEVPSLSRQRRKLGR